VIAGIELLTPTRATGLAAYGFGFICCVIAAIWATVQATRSRLAVSLALCEAAFFLDILFNLRWSLHQFLMNQATQLTLYASRRGPQTLVLVVFVLLFFAGLGLALRSFRGNAYALLAISGVSLSLLLWCTEVVSLHAVDHILYHPIGQYMTVSFLWVLACLMTSIGIVGDSSTVRKLRRVRRG